MRKQWQALLSMALMLGAFCRPASATVQAKEHRVSLNLGVGIPLSDFDFTSVGGPKEAIASPGLAVSGQYLYHLTPNIGVGGEFGYSAFGDKEHTLPLAIVTTGMRALKFEGIARYVFVPEKRVNPYLIGGLGVGTIYANAKTRPAAGFVWAGTGTTETRTNFDGSATGVAYSLGAGIEGTITDSLIAGLDFRWHGISASKTFDDQALPGVKDEIKSGNGLVIAAGMGWKFGH